MGIAELPGNVLDSLAYYVFIILARSIGKETGLSCSSLPQVHILGGVALLFHCVAYIYRDQVIA